MKKFLIIFLFVVSCAKNQNIDNEFIDISYDEKLTLDEFKIRLENYANYNPYPNIDN